MSPEGRTLPARLSAGFRSDVPQPPGRAPMTGLEPRSTPGGSRARALAAGSQEPHRYRLLHLLRRRKRDTGRIGGVSVSRWAVQECFQAAKNETGLDPLPRTHYQVHGYRAWYRHITLSMAALAFLVRAPPERSKGGSEHVWSVCPIPLSVNEIRRLLNRVVVRVSDPVEHVLAWSLFRGRSQQRARVSHYRRRTGNNLSLEY